MFSRRMTPGLLALTLLGAASCAQTPAISQHSAAPTLSSSALDVPIESIAATQPGRDVLDQDFPGLRDHVMYGFFKSMSLNQISAMSSGKITPEMMDKAQRDLSALTFVAAAQPPRPSDFEEVEPVGSQASIGGPPK